MSFVSVQSALSVHIKIMYTFMFVYTPTVCANKMNNVLMNMDTFLHVGSQKALAKSAGTHFSFPKISLQMHIFEIATMITVQL